MAPRNSSGGLSESVGFAHSDGGYDVRYLLAFEHAEFVECAYLAILKRRSDAQGRTSAMKFLESGGDKVPLLGGLRYSDEGRACGVHVRGLRARYLLHRAYAIPVLGYLLESVVLAASLPRIARRARAVTFRGAARDFSIALEAAHRSDALEHLLADEANVWRTLQESVETMDASNQHRFTEEANARRALQASIETIDATSQERMEALESALAGLRKHVSASISAASHLPSDLDDLYAKLEETFRGSRDDIKARVAVYLPRLVDARVGASDRPVLDLGCGRGEWLEVLREQGLVGRGVDVNKVWLEALRARGLDVVEGELIEYLRNSADASAGAITALHVVEHLPFPALVELVDQARRVLKSGGLLILETPNPRNVLVSSHSFHLDPTHRSPIPSALLKFLLEARGFESVEVLELHPWTHEWSGIESEFDRYLVANLFAPQDYAVLARAPGEG